MILYGKAEGIQHCGDDIIKCMHARDDAKTAYRKNHGEIDPGQHPKDKRKPDKRLTLPQMAVDKEEMVMHAE